MKEDEMTAIFVLLEMAKEDPRVTRSPPAAPFLLRPCSSEIREEAFAYVLPSVLSALDLLKEDNAKDLICQYNIKVGPHEKHTKSYKDAPYITALSVH
ncbi:hypothetical protein Taro_030048 [Colocasia esculenta]|uniref:Uncharacterized protein n=1 Tax=Colocasia esculenta TaxID=4460 RepID=A0A843VQU3_COLES|nr:hypothetical protein [Colocasia esculenta]